MLRAVSQIVTRSAAATTTMTAATSSQRRQTAHRSALLMAVLLAGALVEVVLAGTRPIDAPEAVPLTRRPAGLLGGEVLPLAVEELHGVVGERLRLNVSPATRHLTGHVPAVLPVRLAVRESAQSADDTADGSRRDR